MAAAKKMGMLLSLALVATLVYPTAAMRAYPGWGVVSSAVVISDPGFSYYERCIVPLRPCAAEIYTAEIGKVYPSLDCCEALDEVEEGCWAQRPQVGDQIKRACGYDI